ncbi:MAG: ATP-binding protein [Defluviitaleaceae bacterium]|nr:ATP-binding protein [Defluviitaleaceae bacterium]
MKSTFALKFVIGLVLLSLLAILSVGLAVNTFVRYSIYGNLLEIAERDQIIYSNEIDEWFAVAKERVHNLSTIMRTLPTEEEMENMAITFVEYNEAIENVFIGFSDGRLINAVGWTAPEDWTPVERPWYIAARSVPYGEVVITGTYLSDASGNIAVSAAVYVPGLSGVGATVGTAIPINNVLERVALHPVMSDGYLILVDVASGGEIIIHPNPDYAPGADGQTRNIRDITNGDVFLNHLSAAEIVQFEDNLLGSAHLITTPLNVIDWVLIAVVPASPTEGIVARYTFNFVLVFGLIALVFIIIAAVIAMRYSKGMSNFKNLKIIIDALPVGCSLRNKNFEVFDCNQVDLDLFGLKNKEEYFAKWRDLMPEYQPDCSRSGDHMQKCIASAVETGQAGIELMFKKIDGTPFPAEFTIIRVKLQDDDGFVVFVRDLTAVYNYRQEQAEMLAKLEEALGKANAASLAKSHFLSNMSHEIRTPLHAISGMLAIGKSAADVQSKDYAFENIETASNYLLGIISDILEISKIEAGKFELKCKSFDFRKKIAGVADILKLQMEKKQLKFVVELDDAIPQFIVGDAIRLMQVITNLLTNAVKFTPHGGTISLTVKCLRSDVGMENELYFEVVDTGIGISKDQQARLFDAFEQVESAASRKFGGVGLGLAICKRIVGAMGGEILIDSEPGKGAKFMFTLRFEVGDSERGSFGGVDNMQISPTFENCRLLLVDDVDINREILIAILEPTGIQIECASNGLDAVNMFSDAPDRYDIILMDIQMPAMDGFTATRRIRELPYGRAMEVPIIAMTANVFQEDIDQCKEAGMNDHLSKPIDVELLMIKLNVYITEK